MADRRIRDLERRLAAGDPSALTPILNVRLRSGSLTQDQVRLLGHAGVEEARALAGGEDWPDELQDVVEGLARWGPRVCAAAALAGAGAAVSVFEARYPQDGRLRACLAVVEQALRGPSDADRVGAVRSARRDLMDGRRWSPDRAAAEHARNAGVGAARAARRYLEAASTGLGAVWRECVYEALLALMHADPRFRIAGKHVYEAHEPTLQSAVRRAVVRSVLASPAQELTGDASLETLELSPGLAGRLRRYETVAALASAGRAELLALPGVGPKAVERIEGALERLGARLGP